MSYNLKIINYRGSYQVRLYSSVFDRSGSKFAPIPYSKLLPDFESEDFFAYLDDLPFIDFVSSESDPDRSLYESLRRSKNSIYYLARSNSWDYFVTLTFRPDPVLDRYNFSDCSQALRKWLNNLRSRYCSDLIYLFVPELHKDGAYHFHGLLSQCSGLPLSDSGLKDNSGRVIYNLSGWHYGFSTATIVEDTDKCSSYLTKYITKDLCAVCDGRNRYRASLNIHRAPVYDFLVPLELRDSVEDLVKSSFSFSRFVSNDFFDLNIFELDPEASAQLAKKIALVD